MIYYFSMTVGATIKVYVPLSMDITYYNNTGMPWLQSIKDIERKINVDGTFEGTEFEIVIHDEDRWLRGQVAAKTELKGCLCQVVCDFCTFNGIIYDWNIGKGLVFTLVVRDYLSHYLDLNMPILKLNQTLFPNMPAENIGLSYIYPFGIMDSAGMKDAHGVYDCPCIHTGNKDFLVACHYDTGGGVYDTIESVDAVYLQSSGGAWTTQPVVPSYGVIYPGFTIVRVAAATPTDIVRVDVHGISTATVHAGAICLKNPADIRYYYLTRIVGISSAWFDRITPYPMVGGTWGAVWTYCDINNIVIAGCINAVKPAAEWDTAMGYSSQTDLYISKTGLIKIRIYSQAVAPVDHELAVERDTIGDSNPYSVDRSEIYNDITAKYCYNGNDYYAKTSRSNALSIAKKGTLPKEINLDFCWNKVAAEKIIDAILVRYAWEKKIFNSATRLLYNNHATPEMLDLDEKLFIQNTDQIDIGTYYRIENISQNSQNGETRIYAVSTQ